MKFDFVCSYFLALFITIQSEEEIRRESFILTINIKQLKNSISNVSLKDLFRIMITFTKEVTECSLLVNGLGWIFVPNVPLVQWPMWLTTVYTCLTRSVFSTSYRLKIDLFLLSKWSKTSRNGKSFFSLVIGLKSVPGWILSIKTNKNLMFNYISISVVF